MSAPPGMAPPRFDGRLAVGLLGVLLAAMMAGVNNRVGALGLADIRGHLGWGQDEASWLQSVYLAGELAAMPFATWCAVTFSQRRFQVVLLSGVAILALLLPEVRSLPLMLGLRTLQGFLCGAQIPVLMMAALRFLPPPIRLHGLALYAMTATFAPNVAIWLAALWLDHLEDWRWVFWQSAPLSLLALLLIRWGIPDMPMLLQRMGQANWLGMLFGLSGLVCLALGLDQGERLDWFNSPVVTATLFAGGVLTAWFLYSEWRHPAPFMRLQLLARRNLGLGFTVFFLLLIVLLSGSLLPSVVLGGVQGFRVAQIAPIGWVIGLPQLLLGPAVALLLYRKWVDARKVFVLGLLCLAGACWLGAGLTGTWMFRQFLLAQVLQAVGQPMAVVSLLFLGTSVVQPMEGAYVSGIINTLRAFGTLFGSAMVERALTLRESFHFEALSDALGRFPWPAGQLASVLGSQSLVLASADLYRLLGGLALLLIPLVLSLQYIPAPLIPKEVSPHGK